MFPVCSLLIGAKDFFSEGGKAYCVDFLLTELHCTFFCQTAYYGITVFHRGVEKWLQKLEIWSLLPLI